MYDLAFIIILQSNKWLMKSSSLISFRIVLLYSAFICAGLISFFFLLKLVGLDHIFELRYFNAVIVFFGLYKAIKSGLHSVKENHYLAGLFTSFLTTLTTVVSISLFLLFYTSFFDQNLIELLAQSGVFSTKLNPFMLSLIILIEGIASSSIFSFILMQYMRSTAYVKQANSQIQP